ncbi:MAG: hypothetical protein ACREKL_13655 [Chthoniobacterales bacterium]
MLANVAGMLAALAAGLMPFAVPWDAPAPPPAKTEVVLTRPPVPDPPPEGSVVDVPDVRELPARWRWTDGASGKTDPGLASLMASGSGQFSRDQYYALREKLRGKSVVIVDLRQEPHAFLDGAAVAWGPPEIVGANRSAAEVGRVEEAWTKRLVDGKFLTLEKYAPGVFADVKSWKPIEFRIDIRDAAVERQMSDEAHWNYLRIAMPDAVVPRDQDIDRFVATISALRQNQPWLHFHCDTGGNRTTLFLTLYDMMRNYVRASRPDIIARQRKLGGIDLLAGKTKAEREDFLERFYSYCWQCGPLFRRSWSSWNRAQLRKGD